MVDDGGKLQKNRKGWRIPALVMANDETSDADGMTTNPIRCKRLMSSEVVVMEIS